MVVQVADGVPTRRSSRILSGLSSKFSLGTPHRQETRIFTTKCEQHTRLNFENIGFTVKSPEANPEPNSSAMAKMRSKIWSTKVDKTILQGVSGTLVGGNMMAIMGSSGAGKTTLLDVLSVSGDRQGKVTGTIMLNNKPLTRSVWRHQGAFAAQASSLWGVLTVKETLLYCAHLYHGDWTSEEQHIFVDSVLSQLNLSSCQDVFAGNSYIRGLSGGQQKRLCIAESITKKPAILLLDEPTSGLDSVSAFEVMKELQKLCKETGCIVACTIHQPAQRTFEFFDDILLLSRGRVAYCGSIPGASQHLTDLNCQPMLKSESLAEFLVDRTSYDFQNAEDVERLLNAWKPPNLEDLNGKVEDLDVKINSKRSPLLSETFTLTKRMLLVASRDPLTLAASWIFTFVCSIFFAIVYAKVHTREQDQIMNRIFLVNWNIIAPLFLGVLLIPVVMLDKIVYTKEIKNNMYRPISFALAQMVIIVPAALIQSFLTLIPMYVIAHYNWTDFGQLMLLVAVGLVYGSVVAHLLSAIFSHYLGAMGAYVLFGFVTLITEGWLISVHDISPVVQWMAYINPTMYILRNTIRYDFQGTTFEGFNNCMPSEGFCFGTTGEEVLDRLSLQWSAFQTENSIWVDMSIALSVILAVKIAHCVLVVLQSRAK